MSRLAGRFIQIQVDDFSMRMSRVDPKKMAMEQLVRQMGHDCPECVGCTEVNLSAQEDYARMAKLFAVSCRQNVRNNGDVLRCPDGFRGVYDAIAKEVKEVRLEMPTAAFGTGAFDPRDVFVREYTVGQSPVKIMFDLEENSLGVKKIAAGLDTLLKPAMAIPTDRTSYSPAKPVNKDVPATADVDAW